MSSTSDAETSIHAVMPLSSSMGGPLDPGSLRPAGTTLLAPCFRHGAAMFRSGDVIRRRVTAVFPAPPPRPHMREYDVRGLPACVVFPQYAAGEASGEQGLDEVLGDEGGEVVRALAQADELDRHAELALDGDDDPALGGPVELGEDDAGDVDDLGEDLRLPQAVLARGRVQDEEDLAHRCLPGDDALDLAELTHEVGLVLQAPGGVDEDDVRPGGVPGLHGVEGDGGRVGALAVRAHGGDAHALAPGLQLVGGRRAEGVGGT